MSTTVVAESVWTPRVTLTQEDSGALTAIVEVEGIDPTRGTNAEERAAGIVSLNPPKVQIRANRNARKQNRSLIDACTRAVASAVVATEHDPASASAAGPAGLLMLRMRVSMGVRYALRKLDEDAI